MTDFYINSDRSDCIELTADIENRWIRLPRWQVAKMSYATNLMPCFTNERERVYWSPHSLESLNPLVVPGLKRTDLKTIISACVQYQQSTSLVALLKSTYTGEILSQA